MELLGFILLVIIVLFACSQLPDEGRAGNFKWFLACVPLIFFAIPIAPGAAVHWVMVERLGFKKEHWSVGLLSVLSMFVFWGVVRLMIKP